MPFELPAAHLLGIPFEELLPGVLGIAAVVLAYLRLLPGSWHASRRRASTSAR
jgi:hypothetical protein